MRTVTFDSRIHDGVIKIPDRYKNLETQNIKVTLVIKETGTVKKDSMKGRNARGILSKYNNPALIPKEKTAWELAIKDKYAHR